MSSYHFSAMGQLPKTKCGVTFADDLLEFSVLLQKVRLDRVSPPMAARRASCRVSLEILILFVE